MRLKIRILLADKDFKSAIMLSFPLYRHSKNLNLPVHLRERARADLLIFGDRTHTDTMPHWQFFIGQKKTNIPHSPLLKNAVPHALTINI